MIFEKRLIEKSIVLIYFFLLVGTVNSQNPSIDSLALKWEKYQLSNGIRILLQPDAQQKEVSVEFWIHTGAKDEVAGKYGFAHFFEHATPFGFLNDTNKLNDFRAKRVNGNAQTRKDYIRYYVQVKPEDLKLALQYTAERLKADTSLITDQAIEGHRTNVLNEMARQEKNPFASPQATSIRSSYTFGKNHPYGHSNYGTEAENRSFTSAEVRNWYEKYFYTDNIILFVVGNFDVGNVKSIIKEEFGKITRIGKRQKNKVLSPNTTTEKNTLTLPSDSNLLSITWAVSPWGAKDDPALQILSNVLHKRLDETKFKSVISAGSNNLFDLYELAGQFGIYASFSSINESDEIEKYLYKQINEIVQNRISENELEEAKLKAIKNVKDIQNNLGFIESRTELLGEGLLFKNNPDYYFQRLKIQAKLTTGDIQKVAKKWLSNKGAVVLVASKK